MTMARTTSLLLVSLVICLGIQGVQSVIKEWVAKDYKGQVCMKIKFDGKILVPSNHNYNKYFENAKLIDPMPNCNQSERTITIGYNFVPPVLLQLTFRQQSKSFVFTEITAKWSYTSWSGGSQTEIKQSGYRATDNFLPKAVPLGCYYSQDQSLSIPFNDGAFSAEMKNVTFQPFADCAKNDYGNDFSSGDCPTDCSGAARPGNDIIYVLFVAVVGALLMKFWN